ncbi:MAG: hypothetical protein Q9178_001995 [Gyalolechia marmorata]
MNRFRSRKKPFHDASAEPLRRPSTDSDVPALPIFSSKTFKRNKKNQPAPKPQVDLSTALPPSDDFRTSLLMPNLSARFSMLREQDDPYSKIGKANDDSVLFAKRASRMDLFSSGALDHISEDSSIHAPIRPPFASSRTESFGSDGTNWTDDDRSIISRARPGEGNTMFGGRQKIYKIPVGASGSTRSFGTEEAPPRRGKALYGDDLAASTFPQSQDRDTSGVDSPEADRDGQGRSSDERSNSPPLAKYNRNRETTSSTNSGPSAGRNSTAATSVASQRSVYGNHAPSSAPHAVTQGPSSSQASERSLSKSRRLYGQGLDQHMYDQQYSAMHRLESLHRQRTNNTSPFARLQGSRSATNLNDRYQQSGPFYSFNDFRAGGTPPPPGIGEFDLGLAPQPSEADPNQAIGRSPPLSPPMSPTQENTFVAALEPNDLGKATASGAFNKPSKQYSEQQYLERQLRLQEGRESPALVRPFSPSAASMDEQVTGRSRNVSLVGSQPNPGSLLRQRDPITSNPRLGHLANNQHSSNYNPDNQYNSVIDSSFLSNLSSTTSEVGSPLDSDNEHDLFPPSASRQSPIQTSSFDSGYPDAIGDPNSTKHSQNNKHHMSLPDESSSDGRSEITVTETHSHASVPKTISNQVDANSPMLGPATGPTSVNGLHGLVRAHLRNDSGQSSVYREPSPGLQAEFPNDVQKPAHSRDHSATNEPLTFLRESMLVSGNKEGEIHPVLRTDASDMPPPLSIRARQILDQATALREVSPKVQEMLGQNKAQRVLGGEAPRPSHENLMSWQEQLRAHHARGGSTETEKERESLATELAERRRAVQDNLRTFVENESRSSSPAPGSRPEDLSQRRTPFGILKSNASRDSLASKQEQPSKAMKMLGIGPNTLVNNSPRPSQDGFVKKSDDSFSRPPNRDHRQPEPNGQPSTPRYRTAGRHPQGPESRLESLDKEPSPPTSQSSRERSTSEASERRFFGRNGKPRNRVLIEEETSFSNPTSPAYRNRPRDFSDAPRPAKELMASMANRQNPERSQSAMSGRMRSNSRTASPGYFEQRDALPSQPNAPYTRTSPSTPGYSIRSAPSMHEGAAMISNESVPIMIAPKSSHGGYSSPRYHKYHRKESISKQDISEPIFKSCTSSVDVVDLPPGASLKNGMEPRYEFGRPPIPPLNPRRKRTQTLLQALVRVDNSHPVPSSHTIPGEGDSYHEQNTFSADENGHPQKPRHKLRKSSSEGGNMNAKARQQAMMTSSPAFPNFPRNVSTTASPTVAHFPHIQPQHGHGPHDVPASAVMF